MTEQLVPDFKISIDGSPLPSDVRDAIISVEIEQSIELLDMFLITLDNAGGKMGDLTLFDEGKSVEIEIGYVGALEKLIKGDIISLEPTWPQGSKPFLVVRGYDKAHRLRRGKKTRTFLKQKVSDIVNQLAGEEGLSADVDDTKQVHDYILQNNQSNIDFIHELARRHFFEMKADESQLRFKKPSSNKPKSASRTWGKDLKSFYVKETSSQVPTKATAVGWDPKQKKKILGTGDSLHASMGKTNITDATKKAFGAMAHQVSNRPVVDGADADNVAAATLNEAAMDSMKGHGTIQGDTSLTPGLVLELLGIGPTWSGTYYVTGTKHIVHHASGYVTEFFVKRSAAGQETVQPPKYPSQPPASQGGATETVEPQPDLGATARPKTIEQPVQAAP